MCLQTSAHDLGFHFDGGHLLIVFLLCGAEHSLPLSGLQPNCDVVVGRLGRLVGVPRKLAIQEIPVRQLVGLGPFRKFAVRRRVEFARLVQRVENLGARDWLTEKVLNLHLLFLQFLKA